MCIKFVTPLECQVTFTGTEELRLCYRNCEKNFYSHAMWLQAIQLRMIRITLRGTLNASVLIRLCGKQ